MTRLQLISLVAGLITASLPLSLSDKVLPSDGNFTCGDDGALVFTNWALSLEPVEVGRGIVAEPVTLRDTQAEVQKILQARAGGRDDLNLRALGAGHSWTPVFVDDGDWLLLTHQMALDDGSRIRFFGQDDDGIPLIQLAAGVTGGELALFMDAEENRQQLKYLGLSSGSPATTLRFGGLISMACHGAGWNHGTMPDFVVGLSIVDGSGAHRILHRNLTNPDEFSAGMANFGLFGIMHSIIVKLAPYPNTPSLVVEDTTPVMNAYFSPGGLVGMALKDLAENSFSVQIFWFPLNGAGVNQSLQDWDAYSQDKLLVKTTMLSADLERDGKARYTYPRAQRARTSFTDFLELLGVDVGQFLQLENSVEANIVLSKFALHSSAAEGERLTSFPGAVHDLLADFEIKTVDFAMAFKLDEDFNVASRAWNAAVNITRAFLRGERGEPKHPVNLVVEFRLTGHSDAMMSPAYGKPGDHFLWLEVVGRINSEGWSDLVSELLDAWKVILGPNGEKPKPHWAKWQPKDDMALSVVGKYAKMVYADQILEFNKHLPAYDSEGVFMNDFFRELGFGVRA